MIYLNNGDSLRITNAGLLEYRVHVSYADVSGASASGGRANTTSSLASFDVLTFGGSGTRNVRLFSLTNYGVSASTFTISHVDSVLSVPLKSAVLQPNQTLLYVEGSGFSTSSAESSTLVTLTLPDTQFPSFPATDYGTIFMKKIAGRMLAAQMGPSGLDTTFQPNLGGNKVAVWMPPGGATTVPGVFGMGTLTATGTATTRSIAATNLVTRMTRLGFVSAATAAALCGAREPLAKYTTGAGPGLGGFFSRYRFAVSDAATVAGARMYVGLDALTAAPTNIEPSAKVNCIGIGKLSSSDNLHVIRGNATAKTAIDLGANFPASSITDAYELTLFAPTSGGCYYQVTRLNTEFVATGFLPSTDIPVATTLLCHQFWRTNNATALAVGLDICGIYIETDY